ncbi:MAG: FAD-binding oxidoreductase [Candidatus Methylumidiphilus sp.]
MSTDKTPSVQDEEGGSEFFEYLLTHYRGLFATVVLLPVSTVYGAYIGIRNRLVFALQSAPAQHDLKVRKVIGQIEEWKRDGCKEKLCTARSGWKSMSEMVPKYKLTHRNIHIDMHDILDMDEQRGVVRVEPLVSMGQISRNLLPRGWTLPVMPELDNLTVGGLIMGFGVETSSHKYGLFQYICESFEIVTAEGKLLRCSRSENTELFHLIPWSYGTLGFLVAAELKIIPATQYVRIEYQPVYSLDDLVGQFESASRNTEENDFVEAILYGKETAVVMLGKFCDKIEPEGQLNCIGRWYQPWFYKHVKTYLGSKTAGVEFLPLRDYYHRHTRSLFWAMEEIITFGNHPVFRWLLGWALPPRVELLKYTETQTTKNLREKSYVLQDMLMPMANLKKAIEYFDDHYTIYPLWLAPMAVYGSADNIGLIHPHTTEDGDVDVLYVDIGAYGTPRKANFDNRLAQPLLEKFVIDNNGYQALYAKTSLSREDFAKMFDHSDYDRLRESLPYTTLAFDRVFDKVSSIGRASPVEIRNMQRDHRQSTQRTPL